MATHCIAALLTFTSHGSLPHFRPRRHAGYNGLDTMTTDAAVVPKELVAEASRVLLANKVRRRARLLSSLMTQQLLSN